jgi:hypothetical protein
MFTLCSCVVLSCVCRCLCDGLITRPKESHQCLNKVTKPYVRGEQGPYKDCRATDDADDCCYISTLVFL